MKPLMYGYMRAFDDASDADIQHMERQVAELAEVEGFRLVAMFYEHERGSQAAFTALIGEMQRTKGRAVAVPSLAHVSTHPLLRYLRLACLREDVGAEVWSVEEHNPDLSRQPDPDIWLSEASPVY